MDVACSKGDWRERTSKMYQQTDNLCYQMVQGRVCLEPLRILARREVCWNGWRVAFHVLGASHAVTLERDDVCITELFTCAPVTSDAPVLAQSNGLLPAALCPDVPGFGCRIALTRFALPEGDALKINMTEENTLAFTFPHASAANVPAFSTNAPVFGANVAAFETKASALEAISPVTRIGWKMEETALHIETVHTYPEENCGVRSETTFRALNQATFRNGNDTSFHDLNEVTCLNAREEQQERSGMQRSMLHDG